MRALLNLGANIGVRNLRGDIPLNRILPDTLESFLDSCASHQSHPMNEDFKVEFNYSWLAPAVDDYQADEWDEERQREQRVALDIIEEANMLIEESVEEWHQTVEEGIKMM